MGGVFSDQSTVDELTERSNYFIKERVGRIPGNFQSGKDHIVHEMQKASPNAFRELYIKDYPQKNEKQVNKLAIHNITSKEVKHQITREAYAEIDPVIEQKTENTNTVVQKATKKAIHLAIKKAVGAAVDTTQAQLERQYGVDSSKEGNKK